MKCRRCKASCKKAGRQKNGKQKYRCKACGKYQQAEYRYNACKPDTDAQIVAHVKEGCGIRNLVRLLKISKTTAISRIRRIAAEIQPPSMEERLSYEVDELHTFVGSKRNECYVSYAICRNTKKAIGFVLGRRTKQNLSVLTEKLLSFDPRRIFTDGLNIYPGLFPDEIHRVGKWQTLRIERNNLTLRINLKRLARRTICFSRSEAMLGACLRIFFWG